MAINERNVIYDVDILSQSYKTEVTKRGTQNLKRPFEFQMPREILEERVKSWDNFFEKYSMEATDAIEVNLETLDPEADLINEYEPEHRVPMRTPIAGIQYWVNTGKPPCKVYVDESYNSDTISSLSESELSVPRLAPSPPLKYSLPHSPQPANVPSEKLQIVSSVISSSSVNTREYILSATQLTSKKPSLAAMENVIDSKKSAEGIFNIEDTYVDVCGTDELPKILEEENQVRAASSISNFQINELERPFILGEMLEKNLPDESAVMRVTNASLKIGDIIPSLQQIRDGPENYNCNDLYSDHLSSNESEELIECRNTNSITTPLPQIDEPVIKVKEMRRRKLFTNNQSPIELVPLPSRFSRKFSANTNLHPALVEYDVLENQSKRKGKKSLFKQNKKLQDIVEKDKGKVDKDKVRETANKKKNENIKLKKDQENHFNQDDKEIFDKLKEDQRLKQIPVVKVERASESFIHSYRHKKNGKKSKRASVKAKSNEKDRKCDKETEVARISATINNQFINKKEMKIRDLIVSLERLPRVLIERLPRKNKSEETTEKSLTKDNTSTVESSDVKEKNFCTGFKNSNINQSIRTVESDENETQNLKISKKPSSAKKSFRRKTISFSSDEDDMLDIFKYLKNPPAKSSDRNHTSIQFNNIKQTSHVDNNNSENSSSPFKNTSETEIPRKAIKRSITFSSDEEDDFSKFITHIHFPKKFKRTHSDVKGSNEIALNKNATLNNLPANLKTKRSKDSDDNLTTANSREQKGDKENNDVNNEQNTLNSLRNVDNGRLLRLEIVSSEDSSDSDNNVTSSRNKRKSLKRNSSVRKSTNLRRLTRNNLKKSTIIANGKLALETLKEENTQSSVNSQSLFKTLSEPSTKQGKKYLRDKRTNGSRKTEQIEAKKSPIFQTDSDFESSFEIFDVIPGRKKETKDKAVSEIKTPPKSNLQNSIKKNEKINHLSAKLKTTTTKACDNNLKEKTDRDEKDDIENKDANYEEATLNPFRNLNNTRSLKFRIMSSDSSECDNNATVSRNKRKILKQNSSKTKSTNPRRSPRKILQNSTKVISDLEALEGENSQLNDNSRKLLKTQTILSIKPTNKNLENNRINGNEKAEIMKTKKTFLSQRDSDSDLSLEMFDFMQSPRKEIKEKASSKIPVPSENLQNNHFRKGNVQTAKKIENPPMFNRKRKKSGFGGSISSDSEQDQSDLQFSDHQARSIGTFQNGVNVITVLPSKRPRREDEEMNLYSRMNIFGNDRSRRCSLTIFGSSSDSSKDESNFLQNFNTRLKNRKSTLNFDRKVNGVKLEIFRTKLFSESDTD